MKFAVVWLLVIGIYAGGMFGSYHVGINDMNNLKGVQKILITAEDGWAYYSFDGEETEELLSFDLTDEMEGQELQADLYFKMDTLPCRINLEENYLRTFGGKVYRFSEEAMQELGNSEKAEVKEDTAADEEVQ